jgi:hypothetical protein
MGWASKRKNQTFMNTKQGPLFAKRDAMQPDMRPDDAKCK